MANLVSPGYERSALINNILSPNEERVIEFKGLNRRTVREDGEMPDMLNLTSDNYPVLSPRKPRGQYRLPEDVTIPLQIMMRYNKVALIAKDSEDHVNFYYDRQKVDSVTGLGNSTYMVAINTKICFFPQKTYLEIVANGSLVTIGNYGNMEESVTITSSHAAEVTISNEDARIALSESHDFGYDDALNIEGTLAFTPNGGSPTTKACTMSCVVESVSGNTLVLPRESFIELTGEGATDITFVGTIKRTMPDMDMVIEWNNRLWGASSRDNTIYACKLGDPKNWQYYQGTGLDSYYAQQGTDGAWTGCAPYSNHILFFKQNSMTRIYGTAPSNYQVSNMQCFGVEEGSKESVVIVNDRVFYHSVAGIMAYDGGVPYCISDNLDAKYRAAVGGTEKNKYYVSMLNMDTHEYELLVFDIDKGVWHKEDSLRFDTTATQDNKLYYITKESQVITCSDLIISGHEICGSGTAISGEVAVINPDNISIRDYSMLSWMAVFGPFDEFIENRKIYSKILLRLIRDADSEVSVYISINEGDWELVQKFDPTSTGGDFIPIIPRRCDRYSIKVEGRGKCSIKSLTRKVRRGTGGRL